MHWLQEHEQQLHTVLFSSIIIKSVFSCTISLFLLKPFSFILLIVPLFSLSSSIYGLFAREKWKRETKTRVLLQLPWNFTENLHSSSCSSFFSSFRQNGYESWVTISELDLLVRTHYEPKWVGWIIFWNQVISKIILVGYDVWDSQQVNTRTSHNSYSIWFYFWYETIRKSVSQKLQICIDTIYNWHLPLRPSIFPLLFVTQCVLSRSLHPSSFIFSIYYSPFHISSVEQNSFYF